MRFLQKLLSTLVGFTFTLGAFGKASARELRPNTGGTVVIARENRSPSMNNSSYDSQRNRLIVLAASKGKETKNKSKKKSKNKSKSKTKSKSKKKTKSKSKSKTKSTKKKPRSPKK